MEVIKQYFISIFQALWRAIKVLLFKAIPLALVVFLFIKYLYYHSTDNCTFLESIPYAMKDAGHHMDLIGIIIGVFVAILIDRGTRNQLHRLNDANNKITDSTSSIKEETHLLIEETRRNTDASRRIIEDFPEIIKSLKGLLEAAKESKKFYFINEPSLFGKIHSYNKRFVRKFKIEGDKSNDISDYDIKQFNNEILEIESLLYSISETVDDFKMIVSKDVSTFIDNYFKAENSDNDIEENDGLMYYNFNGQAIEGKIETTNTDKTQKQSIETKIKTEFSEYHQKVIDICTRQRKSKNKESDIILCDESSELQIYLVDGDSKFKLSMMIFYFDDNTNGIIQRRLVGIYSNNPHMHKALETLYLKDYNSKKTKS